MIQKEPTNCVPHIVLKHIDGPLLIKSDGRIRWLTRFERIQLWLGLTDAEKLDEARTSRAY